MKVVEDSVCHYQLVVASPSVCGHPAFPKVAEGVTGTGDGPGALKEPWLLELQEVRLTRLRHTTEPLTLRHAPCLVQLPDGQVQCQAFDVTNFKKGATAASAATSPLTTWSLALGQVRGTTPLVPVKHVARYDYTLSAFPLLYH